MGFPAVESEGAQSRFITADGLRTHYVEMGSGPPLILVHGGGAGAEAHRAVVSARHGQGLHGAAPDVQERIAPVLPNTVSSAAAGEHASAGLAVEGWEDLSEPGGCGGAGCRK